MNNYTEHEIANIFPMMQADEFESLKADIAKNGLIDPIWLYEGKILDGRNRFRACEELGLVFETLNYPDDAPIDCQGSAVDFTWSVNGMRRNPSLTSSIAS